MVDWLPHKPLLGVIVLVCLGAPAATAHIDSLVPCLAVPCRPGVDRELPPGAVTAGAGDFTLRIFGTDMEPEEQILWNGVVISSSHINDGEKRAVIRAGMVTQPGVVIVTLSGFNSLNFTINSPPVIVTASPLPAATAGTPFSATFTGSGGILPYTWSGTPPAGFNLTAGGVLTGSSPVAGTLEFPVRLTDAALVSTTKLFLLPVISTPTVLTITTSSPLAPAKTGVSYSQPFAAAGGTAPYSWAITAGTAPPGMSLDPNSAVLSGITATAGDFRFTVRATDRAGATATKEFLLPVTEPVVSCQFVPRNAFLAFHRQDLHLLETVPPFHGLSVDVFADGAPVQGVDVTMSATQPVFSASPTALPTQTQATLRTDNNGRATFSINPPSRLAFDRTDYSADGLVGSRRFNCRNTIIAGVGTLGGPMGGFMSAETTRAFLKVVGERLLALREKLEQRPSVMARLQRLRRYRRVVSKVVSGQIATLDESDFKSIQELVRNLESDRDPELKELAALVKGDLEKARALVAAEDLSVRVGARDGAESRGRIAAGVEVAYGRLPLGFEPNRGQSDGAVRYLARGFGGNLYLTPREAVLVSSSNSTSVGAHTGAVRMRFAGANPAPRIIGLERLPGSSHYLVGKDPAGWRMNLPQYAKVVYEKVYPGIDLVFYGRERQLQFDFVLAAGADPAQIALQFHGIDRMEADKSGGLVLHQRGRKVRIEKPFAYQEIGGTRRDAGGRFVLKKDNQVGFEVAMLDRGRSLVIDPVISYGTYFGGANDEAAMAIAVDRQGSAYITGATSSANLPTANALQAALSGASRADVFVTKLNAAGTAVVYSTYIGGTGGEIGTAIAVDQPGNAYVTGATTSTDFPLAQAMQRSFVGGIPLIPTDAFVFKLNAAGSALVYSTYIGGSGGDMGKSIAVDSAGNAYVAGFTSSMNLPVRNAYQPANRGGAPFGLDAFVGKLNPAGTEFAYLTYLGGTRGDVANAIAVDTTGNAYITGNTYSADFPVVNPLQASRQGSVDSFVVKLNPSGSAPVYSTFLGGDSYDVGLGIAVDSNGNAYVAGVTGSSNFPMSNAAQRRFGADDLLGADAFVTKVAANGSSLIYSTYLGGKGTDLATAIATGSDGSTWVIGETDSADFPASGAGPAGVSGQNDIFVTRLSPAGSAFLYSGLIGGSGHESGTAVALDPSGNVYVAGSSMSDDLPVTYGTFQGGPRGRADALVLKISEGTPAPRVTTVSAANFKAAVAGESIVSAFGTDLAPRTEAATTSVLPTVLAGVSVRVKDRAGTERLSGLFAVSPGQINYLIPEGVASGLAEVSVLSGDRVVASGTARIEDVAPAVFSANLNGRGVAAGFALRVAEDDQRSTEPLFQCGSAAGSCVAAPISLGPETDRVYLQLFGTGIRKRSSLAGVIATVGGQSVPVLFAGPQGESSGLDQVNLGPLPSNLAGRGEVETVLTVDGISANPVMLRVQ
jgi:uncharacterized protein (TIGR03437 family)